MAGSLAEIAAILERVERLAVDLRVDPDGHVRRSTAELRAAFDQRGRMEPAVDRVRDSVRMLRRNNEEGSRREFQRRAHGLQYLEAVITDELVPHLRRMGFDL